MWKAHTNITFTLVIYSVFLLYFIITWHTVYWNFSKVLAPKVLLGFFFFLFFLFFFLHLCQYEDN